MTETKRFQWNERIEGGIVDEFIVDNLTKKELDEEDMCELLNELSEEYDQLKQHNVELINKIDFLERVIDGDMEWLMNVQVFVFMRKEDLN